MTSISMRPKDQLEGTSNFNTRKVITLNILEENDLDSYISNIVEAPKSNVGCIAFKKNQSRAKWIIYYLVKNNLMLMIIFH